MDIDSETTSSKEDHQTKTIAVLLVGAPGSGKSTFCDKVILSASRPWVRVCQDTIASGKAGRRVQCIMSARAALKEGKSVFIDRCNLDRGQRGDFTTLSSLGAEVHAVVLDLPAKLCVARSVKRTGHEGNLQGGKAAAVVNKMLQNKDLPKLYEGYSRITFCSNENDVEEAIKMYSALGPKDTLQSGCFGQKNPDSEVQPGIMKFLKKVETPKYSTSQAKNSTSSEISADDSLCDKEPEKASSSCNDDVKGTGKNAELAEGTVADRGVSSLSNTPTLAFPSISTADFQFNIELASDIIVEKVEEYANKLGEAKLVLVDTSHGSKILSLVNLKAGRKRIDSSKFTTFVGDITKLYSEGRLHCNVIANTANWRLRPVGGGVNAAIFNAAGPELETATKERAKCLKSGSAVAVPLPSTSPLFWREGVTHVIHVLGPNMNPLRPDCLNNNYREGCKVLQDTYSALFEAFASIVKNEEKFLKGDNISGKPAESLVGKAKDHAPKSDQKVKRESTHESEKTKKFKGSQDGIESDGQGNLGSDRICGGTSKTWGLWAQALYHMAMDPGKYKNDVLEITTEVVVVNDLYPKAKRHILVVARKQGLACLADACEEDEVLLRKMHAKGLEWIQKFLLEDKSLIFRLGYHSVPSMRQLHLHVISQDFDSKHLKNNKHWNSFNSAFFRDSYDVIHEIGRKGRVTLKDNEQLLSKELCCHRCQRAQPDLLHLKAHITNCRIPFPLFLQEKWRLVRASTM
ncbi:hypothetical protein RJ641_028543 [Dillenia turbinata]|uniref:Macro domain-containing protein n=1 Tax=Dillenia turbinata TaxID=194707 RepID=A0AAN8W888_9MAGN